MSEVTRLSLVEEADLNFNKLNISEEENEYYVNGNGCPELENGDSDDADGEESPAEIILPPEIWEQILKEVEANQPQDLHSCSNTRQLWRNILKGSQSFWLFRIIFPSVFPYLDKSDILNCRSVCHYWTEIVDDTLENHHLLRPTPSKFSRPYSHHHKSTSSGSTWLKEWNKFIRPYQLTLRNYPIELEEDDDLPEDDRDGDPEREELLAQSRRWEQFNSEMKLHSRNPLIGRFLSLEIDMSSAFPMQPIWDRVIDIFNHVGRHLLYCNIYIRHTPTFQMSLEQLYHLIQLCLLDAPNLRMLRFWYPRSKITGSGNDIGQRLGMWPLPVHKNLETLQMNGSGNEVILEGLLLRQYSNQLKKLQMDHWLANYSNFNWGHLTELYVEQIWSEEHLSGFLRLDCPQLRHLISITLNMKVKDQLKKLLEMANQFPNLVSLHFNLDYLCPPLTVEEVNSLPEGLYAPPKLKTLGVGHSLKKICYSFLPRFPSIHCLHLINSNITVWGEEEDQIQEVVEIHGPLEAGGLEDSNVWKVLPNLKHISFQESEYSQSNIRHWERSKKI